MAQPPHPFTDSSADIIICSCDNVTFKLHKLVLSLASDFFKDMLSLPQPVLPSSHACDGPPRDSEQEIDGLPVIHVTEPSSVLNKLFRLCYPLDAPRLEGIGEVRAVLEAAIKYDLRKATQIAKKKLRKLMPTAPLRVFAIACTLSLENEAQAAAAEVLRQKVQDVYVKELEEISFGTYHRLLYCCETGHNPSAGFFCQGVSDGAATAPDPQEQRSEIQVSSPLALTWHPSNAQEADIIVEASGGLRFSVAQNIIHLSSPVLSEEIHNRCVSSASDISIQLPEPGHIVDMLLRICSPTVNPPVTDLLEVYAALVAAKKYRMEKATQYLQAALVNQQDTFMETDTPLVLYAVACCLDMRELALNAARRTFRTDYTKTLLPKIDLVDISAGFLYRLLDYNSRMRAGILDFLRSDNTNLLNDGWGARLREYCRRNSYYSNSNNNRLPCWYAPYLKATTQGGQVPSKSSITQLQLLESSSHSASSCDYCGRNTSSVILLVDFSRYLADKIDELEGEVELEWSPITETKPDLSSIIARIVTSVMTQ